MNPQDITRFRDTTILNDSYSKPLTFDEWISQNGIDTSFADQYIADYTNYVNSRILESANSSTVQRERTDEKYRTFINEVNVDHESDAIARYILNADLESATDLEAIIPYIANSIKNSVISYIPIRSDIKNQKVKYTIAGTRYGLEKIIRNIIYQVLTRPAIQTKYQDYFNSIGYDVKDIINNLIVNIYEYMDLEQDYYDNDAQEKSTLRGRVQTQTFNRLILSDISQALSGENINNNTLTSDSLSQITTSNLEPIIIDTETSIIESKLELQDFTNYIASDLSNTNYQVLADLTQSIIGCDQWALKVGDDKSYTLEKIFSKQSNSNNLSIYYPTINYIPGNSIYREIDLGMFSIPANVAVSRYYSHDIAPLIRSENLDPNSTYIVPDPYLYGNIYNNTQRGVDSPIEHIESIDWVKKNVQNGADAGSLKNSKNHNKFFGYISTHETNNYYERGLSWSTDSINFWTGEDSSVWSHRDIFPIDNPYDIDYESRLRATLPLNPDTDIKSSFIQNRHDIVTRSVVDIFGNEWALLKRGDRYDRSTRDRLDISISTEASIECETIHNEDLSFGLDDNDIFISGGDLQVDEHISQKILTDWLVSIDGIECNSQDDMSSRNRCETVDGVFFAYGNIHDDPLVWLEEFNDAPETTISDDIDGGNFTSLRACDSIDDNHIPSLLDDNANYISSLMSSTSASDAITHIYDKRNTAPGKLWYRDAITGKLENIILDNAEDIVDIDVKYDTLVARSKDMSTYFYRIQPSSAGEGSVLVAI